MTTNGAGCSHSSDKTTNVTNPFSKTQELLRRLEDDHLRCVTCGSLLFHGIWALKQCDHKFCGKCIKRVQDISMCLICDASTSENDIGPDPFYMQIVQRIQKFKRAIDKYDEMQA